MRTENEEGSLSSGRTDSLMEKELAICSECQSEYFSQTSDMKELCPNCAHYLYDYPNCEHQFENGKCIHCNWNGNRSEYIRKMKEQ